MLIAPRTESLRREIERNHPDKSRSPRSSTGESRPLRVNISKMTALEEIYVVFDGGFQRQVFNGKGLGKMGCRVVSPPENNGQPISHTRAQDRVKLPHSTRLTLNTRPNSEASQGMRTFV
jgi:hypothetical protein